MKLEALRIEIKLIDIWATDIVDPDGSLVEFAAEVFCYACYVVVVAAVFGVEVVVLFEFEVSDGDCCLIEESITKVVSMTFPSASPSYVLAGAIVH